VQDAFAANVGQKLLTKLNRESNNLAAKRYTTNEEAYRHFLLGSALVDKRTRKDAEKAVEEFEKAIKLDANYAPAYARLANAHGAIANFGGDNHEQYLKQKSAIEKALAIDENLAEAHSQSGVMKMNYEWDFDGAERALKKAVELDPNSSIAHRMYAVYLGSMGRFDEAITEIKLAIDIEPASVINQRLYGNTLFFARRYDEAITQLLRTVEMDPNFRTTYGWLVNSYRMKGENDKAFEWWVKFLNVTKESPERISLLKEIYAKSGWRGIYEQQIAEAKEDERNGKDPPWDLAQTYLKIGDKEQAIIAMEKAFAKNQRGWQWTTIKVDPRNDLLRDDPRFEGLVKRVGLK